EGSVVVEADLGVENAQVTVGHDDQRVHFEKAHVLVGEGLVEDREEALAVFSSSAVQRQGRIYLGHIGIGDAGDRVDGDGDDLFGRVFSNGFDVHAAFSGNHEGDLGGSAIDQQRAVE